MAGLRIHTVMPIELVARIDNARMQENVGLPEGEGVSRGEFIRRAVEHALDGGDGHRASGRAEQPGDVQQALREAKDPDSREQADPGVRTPGEGRSAAPAEQPKSTWSNVAPDEAFNRRAEPVKPRLLDQAPAAGRARAVSQPGPDVSRHRASDQVQRSGPIVKGGKK